MSEYAANLVPAHLKVQCPHQVQVRMWGGSWTRSEKGAWWHRGNVFTHGAVIKTVTIMWDNFSDTSNWKKKVQEMSGPGCADPKKWTTWQEVLRNMMKKKDTGLLTPAFLFYLVLRLVQHWEWTALRDKEMSRKWQDWDFSKLGISEINATRQQQVFKYTTLVLDSIVTNHKGYPYTRRIFRYLFHSWNVSKSSQNLWVSKQELVFDTLTFSRLFPIPNLCKTPARSQGGLLLKVLNIPVFHCFTSFF